MTIESALADILFIDLNFNTQEIETAKKAATARGEELVVYPKVTDNDRTTINEKRAGLRQLENEWRDLDKKMKEEKNEEKLKKLTTQYNDLQTKWTRKDEELINFIKTKNYLYSPETLNALVTKHSAAKGSFSSLVVSAHHSGKSYFGYAGGMMDSDLKDMIAVSPKAFETTRSVYLWGCYTTTKAGIVTWKGILPTAYVIAGWDGSAPRQDKPINRDFLYKMLVKEKDLSEKTSLKQALSLFKSIPKIKESSAAYCIGSAYVSTKGEEIFENFTCPEEDLNNLKAMKEEVEKYTNALETQYENVPEDTQNSILREAYSLGHQMEHCTDARMIPSSDLDRLIKLIFDHQVRKNFSKVFADEIAVTNEILKRINAPPEAMIPKIDDSKVSRQSILKANAALKKFIDENPKLSEKDLDSLKKMKNRVHHVLGKHDCIKPIWVENIDIGTAKANVDDSCSASSEEPTLHEGGHIGNVLDALWNF